MIGELLVKRSCPQGGSGGRFLGYQAVDTTSNAPALVAALLEQVGAIPTGFPDGGDATFSMGRPGFGRNSAASVSVSSIVTSLLAMVG